MLNFSVPETTVVVTPAIKRESFQQSLPVPDLPNTVQTPTNQTITVSQTLPEPPKTQIIHTATIGNLTALGGTSLQLQPQIQQQIIHQPPTIQPQPPSQPQAQPQPQQVQMHPAPPPKRGLSLTVSYTKQILNKLIYFALELISDRLITKETRIC